MARRPSSPKKKRLPFADVVVRFLRDVEMRGEANTLTSYRHHLAVLARLLAGLCQIKYLDEVEVDHLRQCAQHLLVTKVDLEGYKGRPLENGSTLSIATVRAYIRVWKAFFNWCVQEELLDRSPADSRFKPPRPVKKVKPTFTEEHIERMLADFDTSTPLGFRNYVMLVLLLDTGMRLSELVTLQERNVFEMCVKVYGKGRKEREIGIYPETKKLLWKYMMKYRSPADESVTALFLSRSGRPLRAGTVKSLLWKLQKDVGLEDIQLSAHVFRHTFAKMYLKSGGDLFRLSREMGHSDIQITRIYLEDFGSAEAVEDHNPHSPIARLNLKKQHAKRRSRKQKE